VLSVNAGCRISLQQHFHRHETWYGIKGAGWVTVEDKNGKHEHLLSPGEIIHIPAEAWHRVEALTDLKFFEVVPKYEPDDIIRKEDDYGRT
jgi:mannose-1-phosphate guanylyltransferase/mannose-1-phosphate guanylyltransferase/mannose-6-phosphate isomerase